MKFVARIPKDTIARNAWDDALKYQECGNSPYLCIEHFTPDDYTISMNGQKHLLKKGAIPSVFEYYLMEVDNFEELREETNVQPEIDQLKSQLRSQKICMNAQIDRLTEIKRKQSKEIKSLKSKVKHLKKNQRSCKSSIRI